MYWIRAANGRVLNLHIFYLNKKNKRNWLVKFPWKSVQSQVKWADLVGGSEFRNQNVTDIWEMKLNLGFEFLFRAKLWVFGKGEKPGIRVMWVGITRWVNGFLTRGWLWAVDCSHPIISWEPVPAWQLLANHWLDEIKVSSAHMKFGGFDSFFCYFFFNTILQLSFYFRVIYIRRPLNWEVFSQKYP